MERILCSKCSNYSFSLQRCKKGKINPRTVKIGTEAAKVMGIDYICLFSEMKDEIIERLKKETKNEPANRV